MFLPQDMDFFMTQKFADDKICVQDIFILHHFITSFKYTTFYNLTASSLGVQKAKNNIVKLFAAVSTIPYQKPKK